MSGPRLHLAALAALLLTTTAFAAPPAAPTVTVGAEFKQLRFDVEPVTGASFYQLWFRANGGAAWVKYYESTAAGPVFNVTVSSHLLDWFNARYKVSACNSTGCRSTADIYVTSYMKDTVGYFKPRPTAPAPLRFGQDPALSSDGNVLAVVSGETIGPRLDSAVVLVYRKGVTGWAQEARLVPSLVEAGTGQHISGHRLAINGDGTAIALGVPNEFATFPGSALQGGAAYLFRRTGGTWAQEQKLTLDGKRPYEFGKSVDLDEAGETVAISRNYDPVSDDGDINGQGMVDIFRRGSGGWTLQTTLNAPGTSCSTFSLSGDGQILARTCQGSGTDVLQIYQAPTWTLRQTVALGGAGYMPSIDTSYDGSLIVTGTEVTTPAPPGATWTPRVMVLRRDASGWQPDPAFTHVGGRAANPPTGTVAFGNSIAISRDGRFVAVGDPLNLNGGTGAVHSPLTVTSVYSGAVFVYERKPAAWALRSMIKPNVLTNYQSFGYGLAFGNDGKTLAVGSMLEDSGARGIDGEQGDTTSPDSGAVWLY